MPTHGATTTIFADELYKLVLKGGIFVLVQTVTFLFLYFQINVLLCLVFGRRGLKLWHSGFSSSPMFQKQTPTIALEYIQKAKGTNFNRIETVIMPNSWVSAWSRQKCSNSAQNNSLTCSQNNYQKLEASWLIEEHFSILMIGSGRRRGILKSKMCRKKT